jgi:membrane protein DedA with SNARE-associated domain
VVDQFLGGLPPILVYAVVALCVAAESAFLAGMILPAATALIAMGLLANAGVVAVVPAAVVGALAAWLGGSLAYASGLRNGPKMRSRRPDRWERADRLFARYGGRAVFVGQWVVGARTLVPRLAGINGMRYREFARPTAISSRSTRPPESRRRNCSSSPRSFRRPGGGWAGVAGAGTLCWRSGRSCRWRFWCWR